MDPTTVFCPNLACPARGQTGQGNIGIHSRWASRQTSACWRPTTAAQPCSGCGSRACHSPRGGAVCVPDAPISSSAGCVHAVAPVPQNGPSPRGGARGAPPGIPDGFLGGGQRPLCVCGHDGVRTHVQYACGVAHPPGIPRQGDALLLHRGRVPSLTRGQEERATGTASLAAAGPRPLTGVARADHIRAGPVGTVEGLENHDATRSPWGTRLRDTHRQ